ncbi:MAG: tRNA (guanosine(46)-N7)-methyltransferase TrmB [Pseudomonadota bacterium]|nr:tRNA (guanosine(46)-N7)-methyltransferase TrmB [Pseudomonadota bacterium]
MPEKTFFERKIRSFTLRTGRLTKGQENALETQWPLYGLDIQGGRQALNDSFGHEQPRVLEIGFGMGDSLVEMAKNNPDKQYIGIEVHTPGVGALLIQMQEQGVENIRIYKEDAVEVLDQVIADGTLERVQIYFPDPWHKRRHNKRRIVQSEFINKLSKKLTADGIIHLATDWEDYALHMLEVMQHAQGFQNLSPTGGYYPRPDWRPVTKFEQRGIRLGHGVWDLLFQKQA